MVFEWGRALDANGNQLTRLRTHADGGGGFDVGHMASATCSDSSSESVVRLIVYDRFGCVSE